MDIDRLMADFSAIPGAQVGRGPCHPDQPDTSVGESVEAFLARWPVLRRDAGYVSFLERYAGASIDDPDRDLILDILGFGDASTGMDDMDGPVVDAEGFLVYAMCIRHVADADGRLDTRQHSFAFDVTGRRPAVVHSFLITSTDIVARSGERGPVCFEPTDEDFLTWLARMVRCDGQAEPPPSGVG